MIERQRERAKALASGEVADRRCRQEPGREARSAARSPARCGSRTSSSRCSTRCSRAIDDQGQPLPANRKAMGVTESQAARATRACSSAARSTGRATSVPRGFVQVISGDKTPKVSQGSGRLELAGWIASPDNPLTARVMANRVWLHLFGKGIVQTPDNFGKNGQAAHASRASRLAGRHLRVGRLVREEADPAHGPLPHLPHGVRLRREASPGSTPRTSGSGGCRSGASKARRSATRCSRPQAR